MLVSGVDGGATKTVAVVGRLDGTLLASARAPSSNYHNIGVWKAAKAIRTSVNSACRHAHASASNLETVVMGLAGMDSPRDFRSDRELPILQISGNGDLSCTTRSSLSTPPPSADRGSW